MLKGRRWITYGGGLIGLVASGMLTMKLGTVERKNEDAIYSFRAQQIDNDTFANAMKTGDILLLSDSCLSSMSQSIASGMGCIRRSWSSMRNGSWTRAAVVIQNPNTGRAFIFERHVTGVSFMSYEDFMANNRSRAVAWRRLQCARDKETVSHLYYWARTVAEENSHVPCSNWESPSEQRSGVDDLSARFKDVSDVDVVMSVWQEVVPAAARRSRQRGQVGGGGPQAQLDRQASEVPLKPEIWIK